MPKAKTFRSAISSASPVTPRSERRKPTRGQENRRVGKIFSFLPFLSIPRRLSDRAFKLGGDTVYVAVSFNVSTISYDTDRRTLSTTAGRV
jgi:hypothetical protein